jgi:hypothetical protein
MVPGSFSKDKEHLLVDCWALVGRVHPHLQLYSRSSPSREASGPGIAGSVQFCMRMLQQSMNYRLSI